MDRDAVAAGDAELPGGAAEVGAGDGGFETAASFNDQATATTAASTTRMIMKGSARLILIISRNYWMVKGRMRLVCKARQQFL